MSLLPRLESRLEQSWPVASLRTYLVAIMLLAALPLAVLMALQRLSELRGEQQRIERELDGAAAALAASLERQLRSSIEGLQVLAGSELFQQQRIAALGRLLQGRPRGDWDSVFLLDRQGAVLLDTGQPRARADAETLRALHRQALRGQPAVSGLWETSSGGRRTAVVVPIVQHGQPRYVLGARMDESAWQQLSSAANRPAGASAAVFDGQGRLLGTSAATAAPRGAALPPDAAADVHERPEGLHRSSDVDGSTVYAAWRTSSASGWTVRVALPAAPIEAAHGRAIAIALATGGGSLLLGLSLAAWVARQVCHPLQQLALHGRTARLPARLPVREIAALRDALQATPPEPPARDCADSGTGTE